MKSIEQKPYSARDHTEFYYKIIETWKPQSEVWPFLYGRDLSSAMAAVSSINITHFLRKQLKLLAYARVTHYAPVVGLSILGCFLTDSSVNLNILNFSSCPSCTAMKGVTGQLIFGTFYPILISHLAGFYLADRLSTYPVPPLLKAPKEVLQLSLKLIRKNQMPILILGAVQIIGSLVLVHFKQKSILNIMK